jgi:hypothetical protein
MASREPPMPRGIRNHNPGNIIRDGTRWQGLAEDQSGDGRFCIFREAFWGLRALARVLVTYHRKRGLRSVAAIIRRYAPPVENQTDAYIAAVARSLGLGAEEDFPLTEDRLVRLMRAIIRHENGQQPYAEAALTTAARSALVP